MITQTLQLNLVPKGVWPRLYVSQYDAGSRTLTFEIYNGDQRFTLTSGTTAKIQGTKPDRHGFSYDANVDTSNNVITADITQQMTAAHGEAYCELVLFKSGQRIGTLNFVMMIQQAGLNDETDTSDSDLPDIIAEATEQMLTAEAYAKGTRNGTAVTSGQTGYHDNSKYYKEQAATQASNASTSATNANTNALKAEGYAVGKQNGTTQTSGTYYHNNAQYYKEQAASSATTASTKAGEASSSANTASQKASAASTSAQTASDKALVAEGYAKGTQNGTPVGSTSPYYHNNAEYFKNLANPTVAANVSFNNSGTEMSSTNVQDGIVENRTSIQNLSNKTNAILDNIKYEGVKNLFPFPYYEKTKSGYTVNGNGSIDVNVTTTSSSPSSFNLINNDSSSTWIQDYIGRTLRIAIKSYPTNSDMQMQFTIRDSENNVLINKTVNGSATDASQTFTVPNDAYNATCQLYIARSKTVQVRAYPLLCDDVLYQADPNWQEPAKSNIVLTKETTGLIDNTKANGCVNSLGITKDELHSLNTVGSWSGETYTESGATFACEYDDAGYLKKVTVNKSSGTESNSSLYLKLKPQFPYLPIKLIGCPSGGGTNWDDRKYYLYYANWSNTTGLVGDYGNGGIITSQFNYSSYPSARLSLQIKSGQTANNLVFYPMLIPPTMQEVNNANPVPYAKSNKELTDLWDTNKYVEYDVTGGETTWLDFTNATRKLLVNTFTRHCFLIIQNVTTRLAFSAGMVRGVSSLPYDYLYKPPYNTYGVGRVIKDGTLYSKVVFSKNSTNNAIAMVVYEDIPAGAEISFNIEWMY